METGESLLKLPTTKLKQQDVNIEKLIKPKKSPPPKNFDNSPTRPPKKASLKHLTDEKIRSLQFKKY